MKLLQKTRKRKHKLPKATSRICTKFNTRITSKEQTGVICTDYLSQQLMPSIVYATSYFMLNRRLQLEKQLQTQQLTDEERQNILQALERKERDFTRLQRQRMSASDFELLTIIGRGAFGEVSSQASHMSSVKLSTAHNDIKIVCCR